MFSTSKQKSLVGLDIEAGSIAASEVSANGSVRVLRHGIAELDPGVFREGEVTDPDALAEALKELFARNKLSKSVRLGIANQRVAVRTLFLPALEDGAELETAIRFQAQEHIPMPLDQAVLDWQVVGHTASEGGERRVEVVVVAARRDMVSSLLEALEKAGLRPEGIDLSAFGMIRALADGAHAGVGAAGFVAAPTPGYVDPGASAPAAPGVAEPVGDPGVAPRPEPAADAAAEPGPATAQAASATEPESDAPAGAGLGGPAPRPARLYCNLGDVVNLAVAQGASCLFTRISPLGVEGIAQKLAERRRLTLAHARQWLVHVGLERPAEEIEGDAEIVRSAREVLDEGAAKLADELRLSLEFYGAQEGAVAVESIVACGPGTTIPGIVERLQRDLGHPFAIGRPAALSALGDAAAARLTLSYGIALDG